VGRVRCDDLFNLQLDWKCHAHLFENLRAGNGGNDPSSCAGCCDTNLLVPYLKGFLWSLIEWWPVCFCFWRAGSQAVLSSNARFRLHVTFSPRRFDLACSASFLSIVAASYSCTVLVFGMASECRGEAFLYRLPLLRLALGSLGLPGSYCDALIASRQWASKADSWVLQLLFPHFDQFLAYMIHFRLCLSLLIGSHQRVFRKWNWAISMQLFPPVNSSPRVAFNDLFMQ
jgi:hypothetical protein